MKRAIIYITIQKFGVDFVSSAQQGYIYLLKQEKLIKKYDYNLKDQLSIFWISSLLQSTVSRDPSEITLLICCLRNICYYFNVEYGCAAECYCGNHNTMKEQLLFKIVFFL